jgi:hypothetical protein
MHPSLSAILALAAPFLAVASHLTPLERSVRHKELAKVARAAQVPLGGFEVVGDSGVSAQMMFLG